VRIEGGETILIATLLYINKFSPISAPCLSAYGTATPVEATRVASIEKIAEAVNASQNEKAENIVHVHNNGSLIPAI
jgi:hypothetical protein